MGDNIPRHHHYIPVMLLNNFCDDSGRIWMSNGEKIYPTIPGKAFKKRNLYAKWDFGHPQEGIEHDEFINSVERTYEYEDILSEIEDKAAPAVQQIIKQARLGECPQLTITLRNAWKRFVLALARRTPESQGRVSSAKSPNDIVYEVATSIATNDNYPLPAKEILYQDDRILELQKMVMSNTNARYAAGDNPILEEEGKKFCRETGLCVAIIRIPGKSFIIGSHGLAIVKPSYDRDPAAGSWVPISHDVAAGVTPFPDRESLVFLDRGNGGSRIISMINRTSAKVSKVIAGRCDLLVRSLKKPGSYSRQ